MRVPLISAARHIYGGRALMPNDAFEADNEQDAEDLIALHFAIPAQPPLAQALQAISYAPAPPRRRQYKRRENGKEQGDASVQSSRRQEARAEAIEEESEEG